MATVSRKMPAKGGKECVEEAVRRHICEAARETTGKQGSGK